VQIALQMMACSGNETTLNSRQIRVGQFNFVCYNGS
jgi:hypothetical protein